MVVNLFHHSINTIEHRQKKERLKAALRIKDFAVLVTRVIVLH